MSIARLKRTTLCGRIADKGRILAGLQALGCMHLVPLRPAPAEPEKAAPPRAEDAYKALRFLSESPSKRRLLHRDPDFEVDKVVAEALDVKQRLRDFTDRRDFLEHRIEQLRPWGDLNFPPLESLAGLRLWFYVLPLRHVGAMEHIEHPWEIMRRDNRFAYVVVVAKEEPQADLLPVRRTHTGALPLNELLAQLEETEVGIEDLVAQREALTRYIYLLKLNLTEAENRAALAYANEQTRDEDGLVAVQGWVPVQAESAIRAFARQLDLACLVEEPRPSDQPPTLLENPSTLGAGVDLAMFYQVPSYRSWDPSLVLFFSFSLFFAMILSDAGYALALLALLGANWKRLGRSVRGAAYRVLGLSLFGTAAVYGVLAGGYFGVTPDEQTPLGWLHILQIDDTAAMMRISVIIGVAHLVLANALRAAARPEKGWLQAPVGWILALVGGLLMWLAPEGAFNALSRVLLVGGLAGVFLLSSERPIQRPRDYLLRCMDGLRALTGLTTMFGDVLSYLRLFALGLSSASLALTFNQLAGQLEESVPGLGLFLALLLLAVGHTMNLGLAIMSGVVHGLRLNFMEFYRWGMEGEGSPFRAFARKEVRL